MPLQATSGAASYDAFGGGVAAVPNYIEECFSTFLYQGNGSTQTINNGIDLAGKGGLVWRKSRTQPSGAGFFNQLVDTARGVTGLLYSNTTDAQVTSFTALSSFNSNGFTMLGGAGAANQSGDTYASWTFREQPKFFDIVTWTGNGSGAGIDVSHALGSKPGMVVMKRTDSTSNWMVMHRLNDTDYRLLRLNTTEANIQNADGSLYTSTSFRAYQFNQDSGVAADNMNVNGATYVAYLFAHNAGGFGLSGTDNVISCGSFTTDSSGNATVNLGYEPQWIMVKRTDAAGNWHLIDNMRGFPVNSGQLQRLQANTADAEQTSSGLIPSATGFNATGLLGTSSTAIYIAIRRGPMRTPTTGTSVFAPIARTGDGTGGNPSAVTTGIVTDMAMVANRTSNVAKFNTVVRLTNNQFLRTAGTNAQTGSLPAFPTNTFDLQNGFFVGNDSDSATLTNGNGSTYINYAFRRAPSVFDVVCYTGTGSATNISHNLGAVPELMIVKQRSNSNPWNVYAASLGNNTLLVLNTTDASSSAVGRWNFTIPTSAVFTVGSNGEVNGSGNTYVAYLFASCPGVSKVFNYTGNGSSQTINCGFTGGARFVMIKRTDSTGDWYVWDTARGIVSGNDPHLSLNTTAAEVTSNDTIDTDSTGFVVNQVSATNVNVSSATYIFLAIA